METGYGKNAFSEDGVVQMENWIRLTDISKSFKTEQVLSSCSAEFRPGTIYGIVGRNGSGKSVLLKIICGLYRPDSGEVEVLGNILGEKDAFAPNTGALIEAPGFLPAYSGFQNLKFLAQIQNKINDEAIKRTMETVGLDWQSRKKVGKYSMGMKQRLGIAQAIMENPDILLLDEPTNNLDIDGRKEIRNLLRSYRDSGKLILVTSHIKEDIDYLCDEVFCLQNKRLERQE